MNLMDYTRQHWDYRQGLGGSHCSVLCMYVSMVMLVKVHADSMQKPPMQLYISRFKQKPLSKVHCHDGRSTIIEHI